PELKGLKARVGQPLLMVNVAGTLHQVSAQEGLDTLCARYHYPADLLSLLNHVPAGFELNPGQVLFIPGAKPKVLSAQMSRLFDMRNIFRSPLTGRFTSPMGFRKDPFT